jgi:hypothetical protein
MEELFLKGRATLVFPEERDSKGNVDARAIETAVGCDKPRVQPQVKLPSYIRADGEEIRNPGQDIHNPRAEIAVRSKSN